jgi:hypothetical protein
MQAAPALGPDRLRSPGSAPRCARSPGYGAAAIRCASESALHAVRRRMDTIVFDAAIEEFALRLKVGTTC